MGRLGTSKYHNFFTSGDTFGNYMVISGDIILDNEAKVKCKCKCGNINLVSCYTLIKGTSTQCLTCGNSLKKDKNPAWKGLGEIPGKTISKLKRDAILRRIEFDITIEYLNDLYKKQNKRCALTGIELSLSSKGQTASVDRIDSTKGYIEGNVQWVHKDVNMMKKDYNQEYFIEICSLISAKKGLL